MSYLCVVNHVPDGLEMTVSVSIDRCSGEQNRLNLDFREPALKPNFFVERVGEDLIQGFLSDRDIIWEGKFICAKLGIFLSHFSIFFANFCFLGISFDIHIFKV